MANTKEIKIKVENEAWKKALEEAFSKSKRN